MDANICIVERDRPDYSDIQLSLRRWGMAGGTGFSRWLTAPATGRFLVIQFDATEIDGLLWNCKAEAELFEQVALRYLAFRELNRGAAGPVNFNLDAYVTPAVHAKLTRMREEILEIEAEGKGSAAGAGRVVMNSLSGNHGRTVLSTARRK
jgi:hypothetical protein